MNKNKTILLIILMTIFFILPASIKAGFECHHVGVTVPEGREKDEQMCIDKYYSCKEDFYDVQQVWENCTGWGAEKGINGCHGITREAWLINPSLCPTNYKNDNKFQSDYYWGEANMAYCSCVEACGEEPKSVDCMPILSSCCKKLEEEEVVKPEKVEEQPDEMQDLYKDMLDKIEVPDCSEEYPELCVLSKEDRDKIIDWFYGELMIKLKANYKHSSTITNASGEKKINWGAPIGWVQRVLINGYKLLKYRDTRPDAAIVENMNMGTCGDVMAYINKTFTQKFPSIKVTSISMAWGPGGFFNHGSNVVMPINPKTKKQYKESEIPMEIFQAKSGADLPIQWQRAMVVDGWGRSIYSLKDWYNEYKNSDGEFSVGD